MAIATIACAAFISPYLIVASSEIGNSGVSVKTFLIEDFANPCNTPSERSASLSTLSLRLPGDWFWLILSCVPVPFLVQISQPSYLRWIVLRLPLQYWDWCLTIRVVYGNMLLSLIGCTLVSVLVCILPIFR